MTCSVARAINTAVFSLVLASQPLVAEPAAERVEVRAEPVPAWVEAVAWQPPTKAPPAGTPAEWILSDGQSKLTRDHCEYYTHAVVKMHTSEGVRNHAELSVVYSPEYQRIFWHKLALTRGSESIDLLKTTKFSRLRRELGFEAKIYDGQYTLAAVLEDIRVGDILEYAYTTTDANPILRGHFSARYAMGAPYPIHKQRATVRVTAETDKPAWYFWAPRGTAGLPDDIFRATRLRLGLHEELAGAERVYRWEAEDIPALSFDPSISPQAAPYYPVVRCSSFASWAAVSDWARGLFAKSGPLPPELQTLTADWKRDLAKPEERLRAAVTWAQNDIRYFAMAMGPHNLQPRPLVEICSSRFGDCKDKTVVLVALLRELGLEAWPALVNTYSTQRLEDDGPDPYAFNHAIVAYKFRGSLRWIDPTLKQAAGAPGEWELPPYRWGLILRPDELGLTAIPTRPLAEPDTTVNDRIVIHPDSGDAELLTRVTMRGLQADYYRQYLESTAPADIAKYWFNYLGRFYRRLEEVTAPAVADDRGENVLTISAQYRLPGIVKEEGGRRSVALYAYGIRALLEPPETRRRSWPYALPSVRFVRHRLEADLPFALPLDQRPQVIVNQGVEYRGEKSLVGRKLRASHDLLVTGTEVPAAAMSAFCEAVDEILADLSTAVVQPEAVPAGPAALP